MPARESERLLRVALFSHSLEVQPKDGITQPIEYRRKALAKSFREQRKKGVVPVLLSLGWFMFALALSIEAAFGQLGSSQAAHNLAMGLLLAWLPVLVTATTVNRNPSGAEPLRRQLNEFVEEVRSALLYRSLRGRGLGHLPQHQGDLAWARVLQVDNYYHHGLFARFAGQGRLRWHSGVAHPILAALDTAYMATNHRSWLRSYYRSPNSILRSSGNEQRLIYFDLRMSWSMLHSIAVVGCTIFGAFILSCESSLNP